MVVVVTDYDAADGGVSILVFTNQDLVFDSNMQ